MVIRRIAFAIVALACMLFALPLPAQPADPDKVESAKRLFREGNALRNAGDCEGALALYLRSKAIVASVPNLTNAAVCAQRVGRWDEALTLYEELTVRFADELSEKDRLAIAPTMAELRKRVGLLDVTANVAGTVVVDGRPRGNLPLLAPVRVIAGKRRVQIMHEGWETFDTSLDVRAGETTSVDAKLRRLARQGRLSIDAGTPGLDVHVDGVMVGQTPWEGSLGPGEHVFWLEGPTHGTPPIRTRVIEGRTTRLRPTPVSLGKRLTLSVEPASAVASIDGVSIGSGRFSLRLPLGTHRISADEIGYLGRTQSVSGADGGKIVLRLAIDENHPRWRAKRSGSMFADARLGGAFSAGFGSGAERSCDRFDCDSSSAFGYTASLHVGYRLVSRTSFHVGIGMLAFRQNLERDIDESYVPAPGSPAVATSYRLKDELSLSGPFLALGATQDFPIGNAWRFETGIEVGAVAFGARDSVSGTATGGGVTRDVRLAGSGETKRSLDVFVAPEIFFSTKLGPVHLIAGLEVAFFLLEGPELETGDLVVNAGACTPPSIDCAPGEAAAARERSYGRFVALLPQLGARYDF
jgi:hypothetical protein